MPEMQDPSWVKIGKEMGVGKGVMDEVERVVTSYYTKHLQDTEDDDNQPCKSGSPRRDRNFDRSNLRSDGNVKAAAQKLRKTCSGLKKLSDGAVLKSFVDGIAVLNKLKKHRERSAIVKQEQLESPSPRANKRQKLSDEKEDASEFQLWVRNRVEDCEGMNTDVRARDVVCDGVEVSKVLDILENLSWRKLLKELEDDEVSFDEGTQILSVRAQVDDDSNGTRARNENTLRKQTRALYIRDKSVAGIFLVIKDNTVIQRPAANSSGHIYGYNLPGRVVQWPKDTIQEEGHSSRHSYADTGATGCITPRARPLHDESRLYRSRDTGDARMFHAPSNDVLSTLYQPPVPWKGSSQWDMDAGIRQSQLPPGPQPPYYARLPAASSRPQSSPRRVVKEGLRQDSVLQGGAIDDEEHVLHPIFRTTDLSADSTPGRDIQAELTVSDHGHVVSMVNVREDDGAASSAQEGEGGEIPRAAAVPMKLNSKHPTSADRSRPADTSIGVRVLASESGVVANQELVPSTVTMTADPKTLLIHPVYGDGVARPHSISSPTPSVTNPRRIDKVISSTAAGDTGGARTTDHAQISTKAGTAANAITTDQSASLTRPQLSLGGKLPAETAFPGQTKTSPVVLDESPHEQPETRVTPKDKTKVTSSSADEDADAAAATQRRQLQEIDSLRSLYNLPKSAKPFVFHTGRRIRSVIKTQYVDAWTAEKQMLEDGATEVSAFLGDGGRDIDIGRADSELSAAVLHIPSDNEIERRAEVEANAVIEGRLTTPIDLTGDDDEDSDDEEDEEDNANEEGGAKSRLAYKQVRNSLLHRGNELLHLFFASLFKQDPDASRLDNFTFQLPAFSKDIHIRLFQAHHVVFMLLNSQGKVNGGYTADEMGLGKTIQMFLYAVVRAEGARLMQEWEAHPDDHLNEHQKAGEQCGAGIQSWMPCPCQEWSAAHWLKDLFSARGMGVIFVPASTLGQFKSQAKSKIKPAAKLKFHFHHSTADDNEKIKEDLLTKLNTPVSEGGSSMIPWRAVQHIIVTTKDSYKGHVRELGPKRIIVPDEWKNGRLVKGSFESLLRFAYAMRDEAHECAEANSNPQTWMKEMYADTKKDWVETPLLFYSGTPFRTSLGDVNGIVQTINRGEWSATGPLASATDTAMEKRLQTYNKEYTKAIRRRDKSGKMDTASRALSKTSSEHAQALSLFMIRMETNTPGYAGLSIEHIAPVTVKMVEVNEKATGRVKKLIVEEEMRLREKHPKADKDYILAKARMASMLATAPGLVDVCFEDEKPHGTIKELKDDGWYEDVSEVEAGGRTSSPLGENIEAIVSTSPKIGGVRNFREKQTTCKDGEDERLLVFTKFPLIAMVMFYVSHTTTNKQDMG